MPVVTRRCAITALASVGLPVRAGLVELMQSVRPAVVAVGNHQPLRSPRFQFHGTGFAVGDGRLVVTNAHVLRPPRPVEMASAPAPTSELPEQVAVVPAGRDPRDWRLATVVAREPGLDLALLRLEGDPLPALDLGDSEAVRAGQEVAFVGYPIAGVLGLEPAIHRGIVAAVTAMAEPSTAANQLDARRVARLRAGNLRVFQLDATAYPGNSGSPLLDVATGRVVGVVNSVLVKGTKESVLAQPSGITYAIPANQITELLRQVAALR